MFIILILLENSYCEEGWEKYDKFCYKYFDMRKSWAGARHECQNNGGDLLSIADDKEQNFALYRFSGSSEIRIWIGNYAKITAFIFITWLSWFSFNFKASQSLSTNN